MKGLRWPKFLVEYCFIPICCQLLLQKLTETVPRVSQKIQAKTTGLARSAFKIGIPPVFPKEVVQITIGQASRMSATHLHHLLAWVRTLRNWESWNQEKHTYAQHSLSLSLALSPPPSIPPATHSTQCEHLRLKNLEIMEHMLDAVPWANSNSILAAPSSMTNFKEFLASNFPPSNMKRTP